MSWDRNKKTTFVQRTRQLAEEYIDTMGSEPQELIDICLNCSKEKCSGKCKTIQKKLKELKDENRI